MKSFLIECILLGKLLMHAGALWIDTFLKYLKNSKIMKRNSRKMKNGTFRCHTGWKQTLSYPAARSRTPRCSKCSHRAFCEGFLCFLNNILVFHQMCQSKVDSPCFKNSQVKHTRWGSFSSYILTYNFSDENSLSQNGIAGDTYLGRGTNSGIGNDELS